MRTSKGTAIVLAIALVGSAWLIRESSVGERVLWAADRISHASFGLAERLFHDDAHHAAEHAEEAERVVAERASRASGQEAPFSWEGRLEAGDRVDVRSLNGRISAEASSSGEVEVRAIKRSRRGDVNDVRVEIQEHADGITVCAVYEDGWDGCSDNPQRSRSARRNNDVQVHFEILVPSGVGLTASSINGAIEVEGGVADVKARAVNGSIKVESHGSLDAESVNGSVRAQVIGAELSGPVSVRSVNGSVDLDLPDATDAEFSASWVNGGFSSDIPVTISSKNKRSARGVLGQGGELVEVETVNGRIHIR